MRSFKINKKVFDQVCNNICIINSRIAVLISPNTQKYHKKKQAKQTNVMA